MNKFDSEIFNVDLNNYKGPLDVLLDLAKSQKVDLENISITKLADQFHVYITTEKKLNLTIDSRAANSEEMTVGELTLLLRKIILEDKIKIYSNDYKSHISTLTFIEVKSPKKNRIILDNSEFKSKKN